MTGIDRRERTGLGLGRDNSNFDINWILDDERARSRKRNVEIAFKVENDSESPPIFNRSLNQTNQDLNFHATKHYS